MEELEETGECQYSTYKENGFAPWNNYEYHSLLVPLRNRCQFNTDRFMHKIFIISKQQLVLQISIIT